MKEAKPPIDLDVEIETVDGTFRLDEDNLKAGKRPSGLSFSTQRGDGHGTGGYSVARRIFRDYPDIGLLDTHRFIGENGEIAYEGRVQSTPRTNDPQQEIAINLVGWMTYLKNRKVNPLYVDRRLSRWQGMSASRKLAWHQGAASTIADGQVSNDPTSLLPAVMLMEEGPWLASNSAESWYDAGAGNVVAQLYYDFTIGTAVGPADTSWTWRVAVADDDLTTNAVVSSNLRAASGSGYFTPSTPRRWAYAQMFYAAAGGVSGAQYPVFFRKLAAYGGHGLTPRGSDPGGLYITDIIQHLLATYYPKIAWAGQTNTYPVQQAAWNDSPVFGYDILQQLNDLALWETNVWEGPSLEFRPADYTKADWLIRTDDPGVKVNFQGDSIENFANGVAVTFTDFGGKETILSPSDYSELRDDTESNPANRHKEQLWTEVSVPWPTIAADALQYGRAYLAEYNRPKRPASFTIAGGYIRDGAGHWRQGWRVRSSDTIAIGDHPADANRLITATSWSHDSRTLTITVDAPPKTLDAITARQQNARQAANLA